LSNNSCNNIMNITPLEKNWIARCNWFPANRWSVYGVPKWSKHLFQQQFKPSSRCDFSSSDSPRSSFLSFTTVRKLILLF